MRDGEVIPRRKSDKTISAEPIIHENKFEAIIPQETFDEVQRKLASRKGNTSRKQARRYLLAGLAKCGDCNGAMEERSPTGTGLPLPEVSSAGRTACHRNVVEEAPLVGGRPQDPGGVSIGLRSYRLRRVSGGTGPGETSTGGPRSAPAGDQRPRCRWLKKIWVACEVRILSRPQPPVVCGLPGPQVRGTEEPST